MTIHFIDDTTIYITEDHEDLRGKTMTEQEQRDINTHLEDASNIINRIRRIGMEDPLLVKWKAYAREIRAIIQYLNYAHDRAMDLEIWQGDDMPIVQRQLDIKVFVTKNHKFRARIREPNNKLYEITIGGNNWNNGRGKEHKAKIMIKIANIMRDLNNEWEDLKDADK